MQKDNKPELPEMHQTPSEMGKFDLGLGLHLVSSSIFL